MSHARPSLTALVALSALGCATSRPAIYPASYDASAHAGAPAVILSQQARLRFLSEADPRAGYELVRAVRLLILTPEGRRLARQVIDLPPGTEVIAARGRSFGPKDASPVYASKDLEFIPARSQSRLQTDALRSLLLDVPGADVGDIVELSVTTRTHRTVTLPTWPTCRALPTEISRFTVVTPSHWSVQQRLTPRGLHEVEFTTTGRGDAHAPTVEVDGDHTRTTWVSRGRPAIGAADRTSSCPTVHLTVRDPRRPETDPWPPAPGALDAYASALTEPIVSPPDASSSDAFRRVRDRWARRTRDRATSLLGPSGGVLRGAFAALDLIRHLDARGQPAYPALTTSEAGARLTPTATAASALDRVLVAIPREGGFHFVDPSAAISTFDQLPFDAQGADAVVLTKAAPQLVRTPTAAPEDNVEALTWTITGSIATVRIFATGVAAEDWRAHHRRGGRAALADAIAARYRGSTEGVDRLEARWTPRDATILARVRLTRWPEQVGQLELHPTGRFFPRAALLGAQAAGGRDRRPDGPRKTTVTVKLPLNAGERVAQAPASTTSTGPAHRRERRTEITPDAVVVRVSHARRGPQRPATSARPLNPTNDAATMVVIDAANREANR